MKSRLSHNGLPIKYLLKLLYTFGSATPLACETPLKVYTNLNWYSSTEHTLLFSIKPGDPESCNLKVFFCNLKVINCHTIQLELLYISQQTLMHC